MQQQAKMEFEFTLPFGEPELVTICAYCPDVRQRTLAVKVAGKTVSHGICPTCAAKMNQQMDVMEQSK